MSILDNADTLSQTERFDRLTYIVDEAELSHDERIAFTQQLFPKFTDDDTYDKLFDDYAVEQYSYARSISMTQEQAARCAELSYYVVAKALEGEGVSLECFVALAKAELLSSVVYVKTSLTTLASRADKGDIKAAEALLERLQPTQMDIIAPLFSEIVVVKTDEVLAP